jgi:hypothetical protein
MGIVSFLKGIEKEGEVLVGRESQLLEDIVVFLFILRVNKHGLKLLQ